MTTANIAEGVERFQVEDPKTAFQSLCAKEVKRLKELDPTFDSALHDEVLAFVEGRLSQSGKTAAGGSGS
ncbi:MAG: hypothetical protein HQL52_13025 [Magnetococcales bacterium]|nr:hypothetical protein [Magnetococcales bacterium]